MSQAVRPRSRRTERRQWAPPGWSAPGAGRGLEEAVEWGGERCLLSMGAVPLPYLAFPSLHASQAPTAPLTPSSPACPRGHPHG